MIDTIIIDVCNETISDTNDQNTHGHRSKSPNGQDKHEDAETLPVEQLQQTADKLQNLPTLPQRKEFLLPVLALPPKHNLLSPSSEYSIPVTPFNCDRDLFLSLSPVSSFPFRRNELASPDSPSSASSGSIVSPRTASVPVPRLLPTSIISHQILPSKESGNFESETYRSIEPLDLQAKSVMRPPKHENTHVPTIRHDVPRTSPFMEQTFTISSTSSLSASSTTLSSLSISSSSSFKPVLPVQPKIASPYIETSHPWTHISRNVQIHRPVPFLPTINRHPRDLEAMPIGKQDTKVRQLQPESSDCMDLSEIRNQITESETKRTILPALASPPAQHQVITIQLLIITVIIMLKSSMQKA